MDLSRRDTVDWLTIVNTVLIALIGIAVFLARNWILSKIRVQVKKGETDEHLFSELISILPPSSATIEFLSEHDMAGSFHDEIRKPLHNFIDVFSNIDHSFHRRGIEKRCKVLCKTLSDFLDYLGLKTWRMPVGDNIFSVPKEWIHERPELYKEVRKNLNQKAIDSYRAYSNLIRYARRKLGC
jgi:hypothetical protein